jgi:hypothetical protein
MWNVCRVNTLKVSLIAGILSVSVGVAAQTAPVIYQGLRHTAIGNATLQVDTSRNTLDVHTVDPNGQDGVAVDLGGSGTVTSWTAQLATQADASLPVALTAHAVADGQPISSAFFQQVGDRIGLNARFTAGTGSASTYAVHVYDNGKLVAAQGGVSPVVRIWWILIPCEFLERGCGFTIRFHNTANGECEWDAAFRTRRAFTLPNGVQVVGNEVRLVEEVYSPGKYPYLDFDLVALQTNARTLTLFSETAR